MVGHGRHVAPVHPDLAGIEAVESGKAVQESCLPGAGGTDHSDHLATSHVEVNAAQGFDFSAALVDLP